MDATQRRTISLAGYAVAAILFVFYFGRPVWAWVSWDADQGTMDLGFMKITSRPPFPDDARSVLLGLVVPIVVAAAARVLGRTPRSGA
jgi:hypothetical protein